MIDFDGSLSVIILIVLGGLVFIFGGFRSKDKDLKQILVGVGIGVILIPFLWFLLLSRG